MTLKSEGPRTSLSLWVIYYNPSDYPGAYVVREQWVREGKITRAKQCVAVPTLDEARKAIPLRMHLYRIPAGPGDDPVVVETWF